jgi:hypothetical protein
MSMTNRLRNVLLRGGAVVLFALTASACQQQYLDPGSTPISPSGLPTPAIVSVSPTSARVGAQVTIAGISFGTTQGASTVTFNGVTASVVSWTLNSITVTVPAGAATGNVVVKVGGLGSNSMPFTVTP